MTEAFLAALAAGLALHAYLALRQIRAVSAGEPTRAAEYARAKTCYGLVAAAVHALILLGFTLGGGLEALATSWDANRLLGGVALLLSASLLFSLAHLPLAIWWHFGIEARFGFNRMSAKTFALDLVRNLVLGLLLGGLAGAGALYLMRSWDDFVELRLWLAWVGLILIMQWAYPVLIAPLFWKFRPLDDPVLASRIADLMQHNGLSIREVVVMDGTRRSSKANAYLAGLGRNRRVVLFDTLIDLLAPDEIEAVVAHELGHHRLGHLPWAIARSAAYALALVFLFAELVSWCRFFTDLGVKTDSDAAGLLLFFWLLPVFRFPLRPLFSARSRKREYAADAFAAEQTQPETLERALAKLYTHNETLPAPDPLYAAYFDSHPPPAVRLLRLRQKR